MRVTFAGTPEFAARALEAVAGAGHHVALVLTQPDRPAGRSQRLTPSPVKVAALARSLALYQPERLKTPEQQAPVLAVPAEVMVVAAYGLILPASILSHPRHGCLNIHGSLLPRWRGAAPIQRAILAGDAETGVCIMQMDAGLDTGPVVSRHPVSIEPHETAGSLHDKLAAIGAAAIVDALAVLEREGHVEAAPQPATGATYAAKVEKSEAEIDWTRDAIEIERKIRAFNPAPGAATQVAGAILKIWRARARTAPSLPVAAGEALVIDGDVLVSCGNGTVLELDEVQPASGKRMHATDYANGRMNSGRFRLGP